MTPSKRIGQARPRERLGPLLGWQPELRGSGLHLPRKVKLPGGVGEGEAPMGSFLRREEAAEAEAEQRETMM